MSFTISFTARDVHSARRKLNDASAPIAVKAVIELALARIPPPRPIVPQPPSTRDTCSTAGVAGSRLPEFVGILVEAYGHFDETGQGASKIERFLVQPLFD